MLDVYLGGCWEKRAGRLCLSTYSCAVIFVMRYCKLRNYNLVLVSNDGSSENCDVLVPECCVSECSSLTYTHAGGLPSDVASCRLPIVKGHTDNMIHSGLCSSVRYIAIQAHRSLPAELLNEIMGFRGGTLRSCAEVSNWTRLCEVEIPGAVCDLQKTLKCCGEVKNSQTPVFPSEIERLEKHLRTPVHVHNNDKKKGEVLSALRKKFTKSGLSHLLQGKLDSDNMADHVMKIIQEDIVKEHSVTKFQVLKKFEGMNTVIPERKKKPKKKRKGKRIERLAMRMKVSGSHVDSRTVDDSERSEESRLSENCELQTHHSSDGSLLCSESKNTIETIDLPVTKLQNGLLTELQDATIGIQNLQVADNSALPSSEDGASLHGDTTRDQSDVLSHLLQFIHSLTAADIHLEHCYVEGIELTLADLLLFVFIHYFLVSIQSASYSAQKCWPSILQWYSHMTSLPRVRAAAEDCGITLLSHQVKDLKISSSESDANTLNMKTTLSHHTKGYCRPLKPDVANALQKIKCANICLRVGEHPCGEDIHLPWSAFPKQVQPFNGSLPKSRVQSKCEQLENLASAVVKIAQPGHVIVDFCSGGGHLGIVIAYLLPDCQVYLIENKEESVMRAKKRVDDLGMNNVTLFQCNLDYFHGQFDVGVCLHGCGVATDMVLQKCLDNRAAFVVCPCCYGKVQNTLSITYPRSEAFRDARLTAKEYIMLGHAADQTEVGIELEEQGKYCSKLVDTDRGLLFQQQGYSVILCSLQPLTCTTKNNLLIGVPPGKLG